MAVTPYQAPSDPFDRLVDAMLAPMAAGRTRSPGLMRGPATDVTESENEIRVVTELPGFGPDDVEIDLENNVLTLRGEKKERVEEGDDQSIWHLVERRYGHFSRSFVLPREIEQEGIGARFDDGVLTVTIPKSEKAKRRRIAIGGGDGRGKTLPEGEEESGKR
jgi:HSP20 family protein